MLQVMLVGLIHRSPLLSPPDEEPEEDLTLEQLEEKAKAGDARAQIRVSEHTCTQSGSWHCFQVHWITPPGCEPVSISGHFENDPMHDTVRHINHCEHY